MSELLNPNQLLAHPQVLWAAWTRVKRWYAFSDGPPHPEFAQWIADPSRQLEELGEKLSRKDKPRETVSLDFTLVPFPKKGAMTRHYVRPSVETQVLFAAFGVLLGPMLETQMHPGSFGNRWYRGMHQEKVGGNDKLVWKPRNFLLEDRDFYQPYRRAYGLFRRVAHWSSRAMLESREGGSVKRANEPPEQIEPTDYAPGLLPGFVKPENWSKAGNKTKNQPLGYWAEIDLQLAYPSVDLNQLRIRMRTMLSSENDESESNQPSRNPYTRDLDGPHEIRQALVNAACRTELANTLCDYLDAVRYFRDTVAGDDCDAPSDLWRPPHTTQNLPSEGVSGWAGLPTGLNISGLLLNVYLNDLDAHMQSLWESGDGKLKIQAGSVAFIRFADDMRILATSPEALFSGIDWLWRGVCTHASAGNEIVSGNSEPVISQPDHLNPSNLRINWSKVGPEPVANVLGEYLKAQGWTECQGSCKGLISSGSNESEGRPRVSLTQWLAEVWDKTKGAPGDLPAEAINKAFIELFRNALTPDNLDAFVTHLVERMSELGGESLRHRFGEPARQRLTDLHQLVRFEIDDKQVRKDTRLAFGTTKLARAWLPEETMEEDERVIHELRESVGGALHEAPWKTTLWRSVLRAAVRRPMAERNASLQVQKEAERTAEEWLKNKLMLICAEKAKPLGNKKATVPSGTWADLWPEPMREGGLYEPEVGLADGAEQTAPEPPDCSDEAERRPHRVEQSLTAHRAAFWYALRDAIADLDRAIAGAVETKNQVHDRHAASAGLCDERQWQQSDWTFRAVPGEQLRKVRDWLAHLPTWADSLYPEQNGESTDGRPLIATPERESLALAILQIQDPEKIIRALCELDNGADGISIDPRNLASWVVKKLPTPINRQLYSLLTCLDTNASLSSSEPQDLALDHIGALLQILPRVSAEKRQSVTLQLLELWARRKNAQNTSYSQDREDLLKLIRSANALRFHPNELIEAIEKIASKEANRLLGVLLAPDQRAPNSEANTEFLPFWRLHEYAVARRIVLGGDQPGLAQRDTSKFTLHRLLWGTALAHRYSGYWRIRPASSPALGLPLRIACRLLESAIRGDSVTDHDGTPSLCAPTWILPEEPRHWLAAGRRCQLGADCWADFESIRGPFSKSPKYWDRSWVKVSHGDKDFSHWEVLPHPLYLWPLAHQRIGFDSGAVDPRQYRLWCHLLLFFTAITGDERLHDQLFSRGAGVVPFDERWHWRHRVHLPPAIWRVFEELTRQMFNRPARSSDGYADADVELDQRKQRILDTLDEINGSPLSAKDYRWERVDIGLSADEPMDQPVAILPYGSGRMPEGPDRRPPPIVKTADWDQLYENFHVRIGQVKAKPNFPSYAKHNLNVTRAETQSIMREVWQVFFADSRIDGMSAGDDDTQGIILLPESTIPNEERGVISQLARETGRAVLAGCLWRRLSTVIPAHRAVNVARRYLVNEAILAAPMSIATNKRNARRLVREFTIRKPNPAHNETGLAMFLTNKSGGRTNYQMLPGNRWYRFVHPHWGDFTVAICADLLDPTPWHSLRGEIQHILSSAFNQDIDLFDAMTWVRAYENYCNLVLTNHGHHGGSFAWTPKSSHGKEITKLRGAELFLIADVALPVKSMVKAQQDEIYNAHRRGWDFWAEVESGAKSEFKAPPAGWGDGR